MPAPVAVLDANVLYPAGSRDLFMRVHVEGVFQPKWTARIHEEWIRNVAANERIPRAKLEQVRRLMDRSQMFWDVSQAIGAWLKRVVRPSERRERPAGVARPAHAS